MKRNKSQILIMKKVVKNLKIILKHLIIRKINLHLKMKLF